MSVGSSSSGSSVNGSDPIKNETQQRQLIQLEPLQLNVSMAPLSVGSSRPAPAPSGTGRHCKHCTMSHHNFLAPERIDKASNTEKSSAAKHSWRGPWQIDSNFRYELVEQKSPKKMYSIYPNVRTRIRAGLKCSWKRRKSISSVANVNEQKKVVE